MRRHSQSWICGRCFKRVWLVCGSLYSIEGARRGEGCLEQYTMLDREVNSLLWFRRGLSRSGLVSLDNVRTWFWEKRLTSSSASAVSVADLRLRLFLSRSCCFTSSCIAIYDFVIR